MNIFTKTTAVMTGFVLLTASLAGCASKYPAEEIEAVSEQYDYYYKPDVEMHDFDRKATVEGLTFYYEASLDSKVDKAIEKVLSVNEICEISQPVYLSDRMVTRAEETALYVNVKDDAKLIGAAYLAFQGGEVLPFGCYAGASAHLLGEKSHADNLDKVPNAKELQYPFFTREYGSSAERKAAWSLAQKVASDYLSTHTLEELFNSKTEEWGEIFAKYGAEIPTKYTFLVGDTPYPIQIQTEYFHYYFAHDYIDRYFDNIAYDYAALRDYVLENEAFVDETTTLISGNYFPKAVDVYFGHYLIIDKFTVTWEDVEGIADFEHNAIVCDSIHAFSHEAVHFISYYNTFSQHPFAEAMATYFASISKNASWFQSLDYQTYLGKNVYDKLLERDAFTEKAMQSIPYYNRLYDYNFGKATEETFDAMKMTVCVAALNEREGIDIEQTGYYSFYRKTFIYYLHQTYGAGALKEFIINYYAFEFEGKTLDDIYEEWQAYLDSFLEENILNEWTAFQEKSA